MTQRVGPLVVEISEPESAKFTAPLLLVHGLWERAEVWRRFSRYLAHRGWRCVAVHLRGRVNGEPAGDLSDHLADLQAVITALATPPVLVGHDLGGLLILQAAGAARAVVALAPLVPAAVGAPAPTALQHAGTWLARWRGQPLSPPAGRWRAAYPALRVEVREPAAVIRQLLTTSVTVGPIPASVPAVVVAGEHDRVTPVAAARALAAHVGAEFHLCPGSGHDLTNEGGWEERVATVHRWLVQRLGIALLALYEEAMEEE